MSNHPDSLKVKTFRDGVSQDKRLLPALKPDFVAADERTSEDLLHFAQQLASELRYFDENNQANGDWSSFFAGDVQNIVDFLQHPERFAEYNAAGQLKQPHQVLFLTFLRLLRHPQQQFRELTQRHLDYLYKRVLRLTEKAETADRVHATFELAQGETEHRLPQGTLLNAGQDSEGVDLHYATDDEIIVNRAQVAAIKTLHVAEQYIDLRTIHLRGDRNDEAFEQMLRWALGQPQQGNPLASLTGTAGEPAADINSLKALYERIKDQSETELSEADKTTILTQLFFVTVEDFLYCLRIHSREMDARLAGASDQPPGEEEWTQVYQRVERAYRKKINWERRQTLKQAHQDPDLDDQAGFAQMLTLALGHPNPGDSLVEMANGDDPVATLFATDGEQPVKGSSEAQYIKEQFYMSLEDFLKIRQTWKTNVNNRSALDWEEVYRLLEKAQTRKHNFTYPPIGRTETRQVYATTVAEAKLGQATKPQRFKTFQSTADNITTLPDIAQPQAPGLAVSSPVLHLGEGKRTISVTLACQSGTLDRTTLIELTGSNSNPFEVYLSNAEQWLKVPQSAVSFQVGDFILEQPMQEYDSTRLSLICTAKNGFNNNDAGHYLIFDDGLIYRIDTILSSNTAKLSTAGFIPGDGSFKKYASLRFTGSSVQISNPAVVDEGTAITTANNDSFDSSHVGQHIHLADSRTYLIEKVVHARRVKVRLWGQVTRSSTNRIYSDIVFLKRPTILPEIVINQISLAANTSTVFDLQDNGTVLIPDNGQILRISDANGSKSAKVVMIGRVPLAKVTEGKVHQYHAAAVYSNSLQFRVTLNPELPAIQSPQAETVEKNLNTTDPILKIQLKPVPNDSDDKTEVSIYQRLKTIRLSKVRLQVAVENVQEIQLRNDDSVFSPKTPFLPFGYTPKAGSGLYFSHSEISLKKLDSLTLNLQWMGLPESFNSHYLSYSQTGIINDPFNNTDFQANLRLFNNRTWTEIKTSKSLFAEQNGKLQSANHIYYKDFDITGYNIDTTLVDADINDPFEQNRYFKLELENPDFGHDLYPLVMNKVALATSNSIRSLTVYPPYTPQIKTIALDYTASAEVDLTKPSSKQQDCRLIQLHPFGYVDFQDAEGFVNSDYLLPHHQIQSAVFIGIRDVQPAQDLRLLFQLIPGSANVELARPNIRWSYLDADRWLDFSNTQLLADSTHGLLDSGIVRLNLPMVNTDQNHLLPGDLYWLCASVTNNAAAIPDMLDIKTQAVLAIFQDQDNAADHLSRPLQAESITDLVSRDPAIQAVGQPYSSFDGKMRESSLSFYTRVSERLRHKGRAVTNWDYERLTLERFPQLYKVKCLSQASQSGRASAASVTVVTVPDIANTAPFYPLEPKVPLYLLEEIAAYLRQQCSPFVRLTVKNPRYEQIKYRIGIRFHPQFEKGYYLQQLNEALKRFLSPWAYEEQADIPFGSSIHSSAVIHFLETRPYVDYVSNLKLIEQLAIKDQSMEHTYYTINESNLAQVRQPDAILVSAPEHIIDLISGEYYDEEEFEGIGYMIIGIDFFVS